MNEELVEKDAHEAMKKANPKWKFCPFCGEKLKEEYNID